ncbi:23S rRNA (adenine(2030)-N(6))-methyltransferase RlmJ [Polynucleobacter sp. MWH-Svant-W18]|jgi:23S rRNA (adenine2030-N6)-methyltransferase|uniref:23S rRNA (adenine(2030)-N(6))-methyltransferase RlmJ n=1 Tax=Polynucleobacter sp. MWH-Svant-W18 TaxID=1855909 RepID=UPI001BFD2A02|nr:23S rRNA (adenine(2030)-N(6))-methyltransferase RlmJ [Polynucleobacter sp. MWH-Svant-W18]QWD78500.1 23S rRNA (adenine(2030)-N(6))-methyltransferase RlmJ [Polynucleobacter sp. MWH-Svant-W18]
MFSYRHAFHAGSHADILKHLTLIHLVEYLQEKPGALTIVDTHAGAGVYSLKDGFAAVSKEAEGGIIRLLKFIKDGNSIPEGVQRYLDLIQAESSGNALDTYPGSPFILARLLRPQDRLKLFELHPKEIDILRHNIGQLKQAKQIDVYAEDSFARLKGLLPPPSRRGLVLIDPSYEDKQDYRYLETAMEEALQRFATGCYAIWYPILSRRESAALPDRLKKIASSHKRSWLHTELRVENAPGERRLQASGMFIINPPWTLEKQLAEALPVLTKALGIGGGAQFLLKSFEA